MQNNWGKKKRVWLPQCVSRFTAERYAVPVAVDRKSNKWERTEQRHLHRFMKRTRGPSLKKCTCAFNRRHPAQCNKCHKTRTTEHQILLGAEPRRNQWQVRKLNTNKSSKATYKDCVKLLHHKLRNYWQLTWKNGVNNKMDRSTTNRWRMEVVLTSGTFQRIICHLHIIAHTWRIISYCQNKTHPFVKNEEMNLT